MTPTQQIQEAAERELVEYQTLPRHITDSQEQTFAYAYNKGIELEKQRAMKFYEFIRDIEPSVLPEGHRLRRRQLLKEFDEVKCDSVV